MGRRQVRASVPPNLLQQIRGRDVVLWLGDDPANVSTHRNEKLAQLLAMPWRMVLLESCNADLVDLIERSDDSSIDSVRHRGFVYPVARDPRQLEFPPRSMPVLFLNGRDDRTDEESSQLSSRKASQRRLNLLSLLGDVAPRALIVLPLGDPRPLTELTEIWDEDEFRSLVTLVEPLDGSDLTHLDKWLEEGQDQLLFSHLNLDPFDFCDEIRAMGLSPSEDERRLVDIRLNDSLRVTEDISKCDLVEKSIEDNYRLVTTLDTVPLMPSDLRQEEVAAFFESPGESWRPYAAGLPWYRDSEPVSQTRKALQRLVHTGSDANSIAYLAVESGSGATTLLHHIAFECASAGFPTLVARSHSFHPSAVEVEGYLSRVKAKLQQSLESGEDNVANIEPPWLLVFDACHWVGRWAELRGFVAHLARRGRTVVALVVQSDLVDNETSFTRGVRRVGTRQHEVSIQDAESLGIHLNRFLQPHGLVRTADEWRRFWEWQRPSDDIQVATFWLALEFWLKQQLTIGDNIRDWTLRQFRGIGSRPQLKRTILEIAALSVARCLIPEALLHIDPEEPVPTSVLLEDARRQAPGLGLVRLGAEGRKKWAIAHTTLGRNLLNVVFYDRQLLGDLGFGDVTDPVELRLGLLGRLAKREGLAYPENRELSLELATRVLKLDDEGTPEFFIHWEKVLDILESMPRFLSQTSRTFLHHVAISYRRVATKGDVFRASLDRQVSLLRKAIEKLKFALDYLPEREGDESSLNLWNSLALAYQNLGDRTEEKDQKLELRQLANEATRQARLRDPNNRFVLETSAKNLIQDAQIVRDRSVVNAAEALVYIQRARELDRDGERRSPLRRLARQALDILRTPTADPYITELCAAGNQYGFLARAWLILFDGREDLEHFAVESLEQDRIDEASRFLGSITEPDESVLELRYQLVAISAPLDFKQQAEVLDRINSLGPLSLQSRLEHVILLHQVGRHFEANKGFDRLRKDLRVRDEFVTVPKRLRWLLDGEGRRKNCTGRVVAGGSGRYRIHVSAIQTAIPFRPQDFGERHIPNRKLLQVWVNFGPMGPFASPITKGI